MVKSISTTSILLVLLSITLTSCLKEYPIQDSSDITGTWEVTGIRSNISYDWDGDGRNEYDIFNTYSYCQQDIIMVFDYDGYGQSRQGCNAPWQSMTWELYGNNLNISMYGDELDLDIVQMNNYTIRGEDRVYIDGRNFIITYTFTRR